MSTTFRPYLPEQSLLLPPVAAGGPLGAPPWSSLCGGAGPRQRPEQGKGAGSCRSGAFPIGTADESHKSAPFRDGRASIRNGDTYRSIRR